MEPMIESEDLVQPPKDCQQKPTRFRVVKLVSSEPYLRGRWNCKDFVSKESEKESLSCGPTTVNVVPNVTTQTTPTTAAAEQNGVAIDNKIEQAMDLVKSHLMFAVREEVDVLKERIKELESEIQILRAHASNDTLQLLQKERDQMATNQD